MHKCKCNSYGTMIHQSPAFLHKYVRRDLPHRESQDRNECKWRAQSKIQISEAHYRVTVVVENLGWVDLNFNVLLSAQFCWGSWELGRSGWVAKQDDGTSKSESTQPRSLITSVTLKYSNNCFLTAFQETTVASWPSSTWSGPSASISYRDNCNWVVGQWGVDEAYSVSRL